MVWEGFYGTRILLQLRVESRYFVPAKQHRLGCQKLPWLDLLCEFSSFQHELDIWYDGCWTSSRPDGFDWIRRILPCRVWSARNGRIFLLSCVPLALEMCLYVPSSSNRIWTAASPVLNRCSATSIAFFGVTIKSIVKKRIKMVSRIVFG